MVSFLQVENLTKSFGDLLLFEGLTFTVSEGERVGLIARNGAGKTTLLNIITGREVYDDGKITFKRDLRVGYLDQSPVFPAEITVLEACYHTDNETVRLLADYERAVLRGDTAGLDELLERMDQLKAWDYEQRAKQILSQLKIDNWDQRIGELSGGQLKRVALASVLISEPELLILDEPTNHLDLEMTEWLEEYLRKNRVTLLMVTHDRYFLDRVCNRILEIDDRSMFAYKGNYSYFLEKREERIAAGNVQVERARNLLTKELEWMRRQPQARGTKAKYRIDAFYRLEEQARRRRTEDQVSLEVKSGYIGKKIFEIRKLSKRFGDRVILDGFDYTFNRYEKMGIVGDNGTGKSTFLKLVLGELAPDSGEVSVGQTVRFGYYSQEGLAFDEGMKVIDVVREIAEEVSLGDGRKLSASQFLQHFLFTPETQYNFVSKLSGGERRRLYLCTVLMRSPNFLVLDEPTNDLDILTINILEEYLLSFQGCVIIVSHDRYFMDKVVDHLLVFRGNGDVKDFPGNYSDYRVWKEEAEPAPAPQVREPAAPVRTKERERKRTYKENQEFEALEREIGILEQEKTNLEASLSSGDLSPEALVEQSNRIGEVIAAIDEKSMRWLELSEIG